MRFLPLVQMTKITLTFKIALALDFVHVSALTNLGSPVKYYPFIFGNFIFANNLFANSNFSGNKTFPLNLSNDLSIFTIGTFALFKSLIFIGS